MPKNYYLILEIPEDASEEEIRSAFRNLVKRFHPDHPGGNSHRFIEIHEAYVALCDPTKRREYDSARQRDRIFRPAPVPITAGVRRRRGRGPEPLRAHGETLVAPLADYLSVNPSLDEWSEEQWEGLRDWGIHGGPVTFHAEVTLSEEDADTGGELSLKIPVEHVCVACKGEGGVSYYVCGQCGGSGAMERELSLSVQFPPGIPDGYTWRTSLDRYGVPNCVLSIRFRVEAFL
jgi:hypothetical protein